MSTAKKILLLDDDPWLLKDLRVVLEKEGYVVLANKDVDTAVKALAEQPDFAIVDLFLDGEAGSELSNNFIRDNLLPASIPYGRLTSAPGLVPPEYTGKWVLHKRYFQYNPRTLLSLLTQEFGVSTQAG